MVVWIKQQNNLIVKFEDTDWNYFVYVAANNKPDLLSIIKRTEVMEEADDYEFVPRYELITDSHKSNVLRLSLKDSTKALSLAKQIEALGNRFGRFRLYNVDLLPAQSYFYDKDLFPLAFCHFDLTEEENFRLEEDDVSLMNYQVPDFKSMHISIDLKKEEKIAKPTDRISSISIQLANETLEIQEESEAAIIEKMIYEVNKKIDPDFIFTNDGDSFTFPHLIRRAQENNISLILSREQIPLRNNKKRGIGVEDKNTTTYFSYGKYFSYGRVYFKPATIKLLGRIHIDISNSFFLDEGTAGGGGLHGLYEISRLCRMPLHTASRASIGRCLSSLQFYYATKKDILIPWKPTVAEHFKSLEELLIADRGGFIFEPDVGVHEQVAEFDFVSLYPNIMFQKNISAETVHCDCCCHNSKLRVPELGYNICKKRIGIVPTSLKIVLDKRARYKELLKQNILNKELKAIYDARQSALKWILVTSFGYLGFNNAKFGRIDAHIAVCAFDRQIFLQVAKVAERLGFRVLHGIVDSIWVRRKKCAATKQDYLDLRDEIEKETGFQISFEGIYKWIAFLPSKVNYSLPVVNRYFGVFFKDNTLKVRGIEARRRDTPPLFAKFQNEILEIMAEGNSIREVQMLMPAVFRHFEKYKQLLRGRKVAIEELAFAKRRSKDFNEYQLKRNTIENDAMSHLSREGKSIIGGQILRYIITDYRGRKRPIATPLELIDDKTTYDIERYLQLLAQNCNSVIEPFGHTISINEYTPSLV